MIGSNRVAAGIFASRVVGLIRELVVGALLGIGPIADALSAAMRIPNLLQNLLGEGSISAAFVPVYARLVEEGETERARALTRQTLGVLSAVVAALVGIVVLGARPLVWLTTLGRWDGQVYELAIELTRYTALGVGFLVLSAFCLGVLNAHRSYLLTYSAPIIWSGAQIVALMLAWALGADDTGLARWGAIAMVVGSLGQLAVQVPRMRSIDALGRPSFVRGADLSTVLQRFAPAVGGRGIVQISSYVDLALVAFLAAGALSTISRIMPLYLLAIAVFGFSVAVSELTEMSRTTSGLSAVASRVRAAQRRVLLPAGLMTAGAVGGGGAVIGTMYESLNSLFGGSGATGWTDDNTRVAAATLAAYALGLPATMVARVTQNALYSLGDVKGPARIAAVRLGVAVLVGFLCMIQLDHLASGSIDRVAVIEEFEGQSSATLRAEVVRRLDGELGDGPFGTISVDGFPHWPLWEPLPERSSLFADPEPGEERTGTPFIHYGAVGLGIGSAAASWTEWALLRRRLRSHLVGEEITTGLGRWVAVAGFAAFIAARTASAVGLPPLIDLLVVAGTVVVTYMGSLWFIGLRPRTTPV